jgi:flagellar biosynthesis/type III secretory pathway M-ring protein FliF/YscJ
MLRMKDTNKLLKNVLRALPAITATLPFFAPKKTSVVPFVLGAIGVAAVGGIAAVMIFSPRTRYRALDIAKDGYGKVLGQMDQLGISEKLGLASGDRTKTPEPYANGLVHDTGATFSSTSGV